MCNSNHPPCSSAASSDRQDRTALARRERSPAPPPGTRSIEPNTPASPSRPTPLRSVHRDTPLRWTDDERSPTATSPLELVRVTESAALAASRWVGRGDKNGADGAAVDAMRTVLSTVPMDGIVVIGEGEKDEAPMLFNGERVGDGTAPAHRRRRRPDRRHHAHRARPRPTPSPSSRSASGARMFDPGPCVYMDKIAVGPDAAGSIDITATATQNLRWIAKAKGESVRDLTVVILDRDAPHRPHRRGPRHAAPASSSSPTATSSAPSPPSWPDAGVDVLFGIGGTPEGVIAAAALKCMGGEIQGLLWPRNEAERARRDRRRLRPRRACSPPTTSCRATTASSPPPASPTASCSAACGYTHARRPTQSLVMRSQSGTVRLVDARHRIDKLAAFASRRLRPAELSRGAVSRAGRRLRQAAGETAGHDAGARHHALVDARRAPTAPCRLATSSRPAWATSSAVEPGERRVLRLRTRSLLLTLWNSVRVRPGHSAVTCTPVPRTSSCRLSVRLVTYAFVAA